MDWTTETIGLLAGIVASLAYSVVKPASWTKESKEKLSFWLAVVAALVVAFLRKDVTMATLAVLVPAILGTMQLWYRFVAENRNIGVEAATRTIKDAVQTKMVDIIKGSAGVLANERAEYSDKINKLAQDLAAGRITNEEYKTAETALRVEYKSLFLVG